MAKDITQKITDIEIADNLRHRVYGRWLNANNAWKRSVDNARMGISKDPHPEIGKLYVKEQRLKVLWQLLYARWLELFLKS